MATIEELHAALIVLDSSCDDDLYPAVVLARSALASALDELTTLREQIARDSGALAAARDVVLNWELLGRGVTRDGLVLMCERLARAMAASAGRVANGND